MADSRKDSSELDGKYLEVLSSLNAEFNGSGREAEVFFEQLLGNKEFFRRSFFQERFRNPRKPTSAKDKLAIIAASQLRSPNSLDKEIRKFVFSELPTTPVGHTKHYDGFYRYWRFYPTSGPTDPVRWGIFHLHTNEDDGSTRLQHWSHDLIIAQELSSKDQPIAWDKFRDPEDQGFVFMTHSRFFFLSFRRNNIRLEISSLPYDGLSSSIMTGVALTTRKTSGGVFAAGFAMVHESNPRIRKSMHLASFLDTIRLRVDPQTYIIND